MSPERIEQERQAFEAWMAELYPTNPQTERVGDEYSRLGTQYKWEGWQAKAAQSAWISVEERLPEIDESVLVCRNWRGKLVQCVDKIRLCYDREKPDGEQKWYGFMYSDITHWQQLPAPPTVNPAA